MYLFFFLDVLSSPSNDLFQVMSNSIDTNTHLAPSLVSRALVPVLNAANMSQNNSFSSPTNPCTCALAGLDTSDPPINVFYYGNAHQNDFWNEVESNLFSSRVFQKKKFFPFFVF